MRFYWLTASLISLVLSLGTQAATIEKIQAVKPSNPQLVELGKKLFFDPRLSKSGFISCNSCHNLSMGGSYHKFGIFKEYKTSNLAQGRAGVTSNPNDIRADWG